LVFALPVLTGGVTWFFMMTPLPVFYYLRVLGPAKGGKIVGRVVVGVALLFMFSAARQTFFFSLSLIPLGFVLAESQRRREGLWRTAAKGVITIIGTWLAVALLIKVLYHENIYRSTLQGIDKLIALALENYKESAPQTGGTAEIEAAFTELRLLVPRFFPGLVAISVCSIVWFNLLIGDWLLKKARPGLSHWADFRLWRLPEHLVWFGIAAALLLFVPGTRPHDLAVNSLMVLAQIYFFQGLAILTFLVSRWRAPRALKFFFFAVLVIQAYGMIILAVVGLADVWLDFRKIGPTKETKNY